VQYLTHRDEVRQRVHYQKTFLKQVILRLDYARLGVLQTEQETPFTSDLRIAYPEVISSPAVNFAVMFGVGGLNVGQQATGYMRVHKAKDVNRSVTLAPDFLALEYGESAYEHFKVLRSDFSLILDRFRDRFGPVQCFRIGLRYVNEINLPQGSALDWDGLIDPSLVTSVKAGLLSGFRLTRSVHQLVAIRDDVSVLLQYGINNPDFPNPVSRRQFVLDQDCYISGLVEFDEVEQRLKDINAVAEQVFEESIEDGLRDLMVRVST
jgi:uncharacterized protein (TIGR04255 family)